MKSETHKWYSPALGKEFELKVYGHGGKPVLVFPTWCGRFFDFENFGLVDSIHSFIDDGKVTLYTVDSLDRESWGRRDVLPELRVRRHEDYDRYIIQEVAPFIRKQSGEEKKILTTGCGMGAYHAANFFFRHPDWFDGVISLSGFFQLKTFVGDYIDETVYYNAPLYYLPNLTDPWYLEKFRRSKIIVCVGQGAQEETALADARALEQVLTEKDVPCWVDIWGPDVRHDWIWWRKELPYFMEHLDQENWLV